MMESFAERYCQLNPDIFTNSDTCYVLSFAIIMLNTSLHNPSVRDKPSVDQFVSMKPLYETTYKKGPKTSQRYHFCILLDSYHRIKTAVQVLQMDVRD